MTKSELIRKLAAQQEHLSPRDIDQSVKLMLELLATALSQGERIEIRGFGSFTLRRRRARLGRNPRTGERMQLPSTQVVHFKSGKELRESINLAGRPKAGPGPRG